MIVKRLLIETGEKKTGRDLDELWKRIWRIAETEGFIVKEILRKEDKDGETASVSTLHR